MGRVLERARSGNEYSMRTSQRVSVFHGVLVLALCTGGCSGKALTFETGGQAGMAGGQPGGAGGTQSGGAPPQGGATASPQGGATTSPQGGATTSPQGGATTSPQGGATAGGGSGNEPVPKSPIAGLSLDDAFPWFLTKNGTMLGQLPSETDATGNPLLHLTLLDEPARATLSTHNHFEVLRYSSRVEFSAKATETLALRVSARRTLDTSDYFAALEAGQLWPTAEVEVGLNWQRFSVPLSEMKPVEPIPPQGSMPSFMIAFIIDHPGDVELFFDDVRFE